jgi:signal transduction histidine kinase
VKTPSKPCYVTGVMQQLVRITVNGMMNAVDAIGEEGEITITLGSKKENYKLIIKDSGPGIPSKILESVFDPFFSTKGSGGTGLGLYVSYNMVKAHNGSISLTSPVAGGAQLEILLPKDEVTK